MIRLRNSCTGPRPVHFFQGLRGVAASLALAAAPVSFALPAPAVAAVAATTAPQSSGFSVADFYASRRDAMLWLAPASGSAAQDLVALLEGSKTDGLDPDRYGVATLRKALGEAWGGNSKASRRADIMLSQAFVAYAADLMQDPGVGIIYVDAQLKPRAPAPRVLLDQAAAAPSLADYVRRLGWMNPMYGELRQALVGKTYASDHERQLLEVNLERARTLPGGKRRYVLVNTAAQRLTMYDNGREVDSMRVVVGKTKYPTPMMTAFIRYAVLNPYWNSPPDLTAERIAPSVLKQGVKFLDAKGYQVLSDWGDSPTVVDPTTVDWKSVAEGKSELRVRQLPGDENAMGRIKFMFPNAEGIWLHDTPEKELLNEAARLYSGGCVRLEDAPRLGEWLFGRRLEPEGSAPEQPVPLAMPVPVYISYLTAIPSGGSIGYFEDIYGRDKARLAVVQSSDLATAAR